MYLPNISLSPLTAFTLKEVILTKDKQVYIHIKEVYFTVQSGRNGVSRLVRLKDGEIIKHVIPLQQYLLSHQSGQNTASLEQLNFSFLK